MLVEFIHRSTKPESPKSGRFYWISDEEGGKNQIWFAPDEKPENMILLNDTFEELETRIKNTEYNIEDIRDELDKIKENPQGYLTKDDLNDYTDDYLKKNLKTVNNEELYGNGNIEIKTEVVIDDETKNEIIEQVKKEVETRPLEWTVIE